MKKSALFGIAALGMAAMGVSHALAGPILTVNVGSGASSLTLTSVGAGSYYAAPGSLGDFSWGLITAQVQDPSTTGAYQLSLTVNNIIQSPAATQTLTFVATDSGFGPPAVGDGIGIIQDNATSNVTNGAAGESIVSTGTLNPTPGTSAGTMTMNFNNIAGLQQYGGTGAMVATNPNANTGAFTLQTTDAVVFAPGSTDTTINSINSVITASPTAVTTPEPATLALFAVGGLALMVGARRRKNKA